MDELLRESLKNSKPDGVNRRAVIFYLVEMRRIELLSKNAVAQLSPSAFAEKFQLYQPRRQT